MYLKASVCDFCMYIWNFGITVNGLGENIITVVSANSIGLELTEPQLNTLKFLNHLQQ